MAAIDAITHPIYGQAFRFTVAVRSITTGNPITGGLTTLAATASLDGASFAATGLTVAEIGTTGFVTVDVDATRMTCTSLIVQVTAANSGAMYPLVEIRPLSLTEITGRADAASVKRFENFVHQIWQRFFNKMTVTDAGATTLYQADSATAIVTGANTNASGTETRGKAS